MFILIPTAKEMTAAKHADLQTFSQESQTIIDHLSQLSSQQLQAIYQVKPQIAKQEYQHWQALKAGRAPSLPALHLFNGLMYRHIQREPLKDKEKRFLQKHVFITSALYGILACLDPIAAYRLDFNTKIKIQGQSLKQYWRPSYDQFVASKPHSLFISLLSSEFEEVFSPAIRKQLISCRFLESKNGSLKSHSTISKKARGAFLNQIIQNQYQTIQELQRMTFDGFTYQADLSKPQQLVFIKK